MDSRYYGHQNAVPRVSAIAGVDCTRTNFANQKCHLRNQTDKFWESNVISEIKRDKFNIKMTQWKPKRFSLLIIET